MKLDPDDQVVSVARVVNTEVVDTTGGEAAAPEGENGDVKARWSTATVFQDTSPSARATSSRDALPVVPAPDSPRRPLLLGAKKTSNAPAVR